MVGGDEDDELDDDDEPMTLQELEAYYRSLTVRPHKPTYCWHSPVGVFTVSQEYFEQSTAPWELRLDGQIINTYPDHVTALLAVLKKRTGTKWDDYAGPEQAPDDERDWKDSAP
jgi:hypothetical protein